MPPPQDTSQPRLAPGCRWGAEKKSAEKNTADKTPAEKKTDEVRVLLFPEGAINLQGTGRQVLERCDGQRTFGEIVTELQSQFDKSDPAKIRSDIALFLEQLHRKRIVDY